MFVYVQDGKLMTTDAFTYSGKSLSAYEEYTADVTSDILPEGTALHFMNKDWGSFRANSTGLRCECEGMMYGDVHVYSEIDRFPSENGYYLGAPSGTNIYPKSIARQVDGFSMHLNPDDWIDQVMWTFKKSEEGDDLFDYEIKVKVGDREQVIVNEDGFPCGKEDLSVWPIDLEQDGVYELVIYNKSFSMFGDLRIYRFNGTTYEEQFSYIFENMP